MLRRGVDFCRGCGGKDLFLALALGKSPIANNLLSHATQLVPSFPLELRICSDCTLGQVGEFETPETIFSDYPYLSSTSQSWIDSNKEFAREIFESEEIGSGDLVVELASNDGYLLKSFLAMGASVLGVEPAKNIAAIAISDGVPTIPEFFGQALARKMRDSGIEPRVIIAKNVVAHVPSLQDFVAGIAELAGSNTLIVLEAPTISQVFRGLQFDTIYHEHFSYLSAIALKDVFGRFGMVLLGAKKLTTHGGSIRFFLRKVGSTPLYSPHSEALRDLLDTERSLKIGQEDSWREIRNRIELCLSDFRGWLNQAGPNVITVAYGAAAKGVTLLAACDAQFGDVDYVIDNSKEKAGKFFPIVGAPILTEADFRTQMLGRRFRYVVFPWNLIDEIVPRIEFLDRAPEVVIAVPAMKRVV